MSKRNVPDGWRLREPVQAQRELRDDVLPAHVRAVDIVRAENENALEVLAAEIDRHQLADQLAAAVGIARVEHVGHEQRRVLGGRDLGRRLVDLRRGGEHQRADIVLAAGVDHIDHAAHADVEHQLGLRIEKFGAVDEGEVMHLVHAMRRALDGGRVANIAGDEFDVLLDAAQPARLTRANCRRARARCARRAPAPSPARSR